MGLLTPYRGALATPGAPAFAAAGLLARLPLSMNGLALVLLAQGLTRNWAAAGAVAATYALAQALVSPLLSRLVDRHGQARVALPALAVHAAALLAVLLIAATGAHLLLLGLAAALAGAAFVSWGSLVRARWAHALRGPDGARHLHPAFSLESVLDEVVFTVGPPVATLLAVAVSPSVALGAALASTVAGGVALLAQRRTEPPPHRTDPAAEGAEVSGGGVPAGLRARVGRAVGALRVPGLRALALTFVATGAVFGSVEVIAVAFTAERGVPGAAGVVLALYSVGSLVAGVAFGAVTWRGSLPRRFRLGAVGMAVLIAPVALAGSVPVLAATLFLSGLAISPTLISGNALVAELVAPRQLTEGLAWVGTALGVGVALGAAASGPLIEGPGPRTALLLPVVCAAAAALVVLACSRVLGVPPRRSPDNGTGRGRGRLSR